MKFSKQTLEILKNFAEINNGMQFRKGSKQTTVSVGRNIIAVSDFDVEIPSSFAIFNLSSFLGAISLFDDPDIEIDESSDYIKITAGDQRIRYRISEPKMVVSWPEDRPAVLTSTDVSFELTKENWNKIRRSIDLLECDHFVLEGSDGIVKIKSHNEKDEKASSASFVVGETSHSFNLVYPIASMPIMQGNYVVDISKNKLSRWTNKDKPVEYFVLCLKTSTFEA